MNKLKNACMMLAVTILLTGCLSTLFGGKKIKISVVDNKTNTLIEGVNCIISSSNGSNYFLESNPGIIDIPQNEGALIINCKKSGYRELNTFVTGGTSSKPSTFSLRGPGDLFINLEDSSSNIAGYKSHYVFSMEKANDY